MERQRGGLGKEADGGIGSGGEDPGLRGVEGDVEDAQVAGDRLALQHLHRDDEGVSGADRCTDRHITTSEVKYCAPPSLDFTSFITLNRAP